MTKTIRRLNIKLIRKTGFTLRQWAFMLATGLFLAMWLTGNLPNNYEYMLSHM